MEYPKGRATSQPVRVSEGLDEAMESFLRTERARLLGFRFKSDVVNQAVREFLVKYGFEVDEASRFEHFNVYEDHVTIFDKKERRLVDVYLRNGRAYCGHDDSFDCEHIRFALSIPKVAEALKEAGWAIDDGRIIRAPP